MRSFRAWSPAPGVIISSGSSSTSDKACDGCGETRGIGPLDLHADAPLRCTSGSSLAPLFVAQNHAPSRGQAARINSSTTPSQEMPSRGWWRSASVSAICSARLCFHPAPSPPPESLSSGGRAGSSFCWLLREKRPDGRGMSPRTASGTVNASLTAARGSPPCPMAMCGFHAHQGSSVRDADARSPPPPRADPGLPLVHSAAESQRREHILR